MTDSDRTPSPVQPTAQRLPSPHRPAGNRPMSTLAKIIAASEEWLVRRVLHHAGEHGYWSFISLPEKAWRKSISDICRIFLKTLKTPRKTIDLNPATDYSKDPVAAFGAQIAQDHQARGVSFETLFSLMKYYRQSFDDLVRESDIDQTEEEAGRLLVARFFDHLEIGLLAGWTEKKYQEEIRRLNTGLERRVALRTAQLNRLQKENDKKLQELSFLYRMSNTMLSTIQLNKLAHLILSALTSGETPLFDRAMLFLINERSATMQGMLGITRETSSGLISPDADPANILASRWDMADEVMSRQRDSEFSRRVRESRLELNRKRNAASRAVLGKKLMFIPDTSKAKRIDHEFVRRFGITSFAIAPLIAKENVIGLIVVDNNLSTRRISRDDLRFLQLFANQAGMAIENSILYNRLEDANRNLREARENLLQRERLSTIGEMAAGIAHEIKGPLVSIGGFARRLERHLSARSAEKDHASTIVREVERLEKMLTDILSFSRKTTICYSCFDIRDIVEESLSIIADALNEQRITVVRSYPHGAISLLGDCHQMKQVFLNLLINSLEAMPGGGELRITIAPARLSGARAVSVKVADSGGGIPIELLGSIFISFFTTKEAGTGLGLPIASRIVANHGGKIHVTNEPGIGAEFNVILPLNPASAAARTPRNGPGKD
jgi:signal transduction histidine kinase